MQALSVNDSRELTNYQELFRQADRFAGIDTSTPHPKKGDTSEFDQLCIEAAGQDFQRDWRKYLRCHEHDIVVLRKCYVKITVPYTPPTQFTRKKRYHHFTNSIQHKSPSNSWEKYLLFSKQWEDQIIWDDEEKEQLQLDDEDGNLNDMRIPVNSDMHSGTWIKGIIWDDEHIELYDDDNWEDTSDKFLQLILPDSNSSYTLRPGTGWTEDVKERYHARVKRAKADEISRQGVAILSSSSTSTSHRDGNANIHVDKEDEQEVGDEDDDDEDEEDEGDGGEGTAAVAGGGVGGSGRHSTSLSRSQRQKRNEREKKERLRSVRVHGLSTANVPISSYAIKKAKEEPGGGLSRRKKLVLPSVDHAVIAARHNNFKSELSAAELRFFHRPRLGAKVLGMPWTIMARKDAASKIGQTKRKSQSADGSAAEGRSAGNWSSLSRATQMDELSVSDGDFICIEYVERIPHLIANPGMAIRILNFFRTNPTESVADLNLTENAKQEEGIGSATNIKKRSIMRLPRHLQYLLDDKRRTQGLHIEQDLDIPRLADGQTITLNADEESPFLGEIAPGQLQSSLHSHLFQAPLFPHKPRGNDFLLIRQHKMKGIPGYFFSIRALPTIFVSGQQEPLKVVHRPSKKLTKIQEELALLRIARYFDNCTMRVDLDQIIDELPSAYKPAEVRRLLRTVANEGEDGMWTGKDESERPTAETYESRILPEDVCVQDSSSMGELRLKECGIPAALDRVDGILKVETWLDRMLKRRNYVRNRADNARELELALSNTQRGPTLKLLANNVQKQVQRIQKKLDVGRSIHERLLSTPWACTDAFVKGHLERGPGGPGAGMELSGPGDPSGIGEGFAFVRKLRHGGRRGAGRDMPDNPDLAPISHTNRDLRKLHTKEATRILVEAGMDPMDVKSLKRWDKIAMIRELSTRAQEAGTAEGLHRYARGQKALGSMKDTHEGYKEACNRIWSRQAAALSSEQPPDDDDDNDEMEDDSDDELEGDLEKELEQRDAREEASGSSMTKSSSSGVLSGSSLSSRQLASRVEAEDKRALLELQSKLDTVGSSATSKASGSTPSLKPKFTSGQSGSPALGTAALKASMSSTWRPPSRVVKQITRLVKTDGSEVVEVRFIVSEAEVARVEKEERNLEKLWAQRHKAGADIGVDASGGEDSEAGPGPTLRLGTLKSVVERHDTEQRERDYDEEVRPQRANRDHKRGNIKLGRRNMRLPLPRLEVELERILLEVWRRKAAAPFIQPVDLAQFPDYRYKVSHPISLTDIREKLAKGKYLSSRSFLADLKLMADNASLYNGSDAKIAQDAHQLFRTAKELIEADKDSFELYEGDVRAKFSTLNRSLKEVTASTVPNVMMSVPDMSGLTAAPGVSDTAIGLKPKSSTSVSKSSSKSGTPVETDPSASASGQKPKPKAAKPAAVSVTKGTNGGDNLDGSRVKDPAVQERPLKIPTSASVPAPAPVAISEAMEEDDFPFFIMGGDEDTFPVTGTANSNGSSVPADLTAGAVGMVADDFAFDLNGVDVLIPFEDGNMLGDDIDLNETSFTQPYGSESSGDEEVLEQG